MGVLTLDDRDPSIIYSPGWLPNGVPTEFNGTTTAANQPGLTAVLSFTGTSVAVYGTIPTASRGSIAPVSMYKVDNGPVTRFDAKETTAVQFSHLFFQSDVLPAGPHILTFANVLKSDPLFIDFFLVDGAVTSPVTTSSSAASSTSSTISSTSSTVSTSSTIAPVTVTVTSPPATTSIPALTSSSGPSPTGNSLDSTSGSTSSNHTGAIAGGIIAAIVALFLIGVAVVLWRRRQRKRNSEAFVSTFWDRPPPTVPAKSSAIDPSPASSNRHLPMSQTAAQPAGYDSNQWQSRAGAYPAQAPYPSPNAEAYAQDAYAQDAYTTAQPMYPNGGYAPGYNQGSSSAYYASQQSTPQQTTGGYVPPSQLLRQGADYNRGMPAPTGNYATYTGDGRTRINLNG